jgi:hypothetical protein
MMVGWSDDAPPVGVVTEVTRVAPLLVVAVVLADERVIEWE